MRKAKHSNRDHLTGQYAHDGSMERMCVCGHIRGLHAEGGYDCLAGEGSLSDTPPPGQFCDCMKFREIPPLTHYMKFALPYVPDEWQEVPGHIRNSTARGLAKRGHAEIRDVPNMWPAMEWRKVKRPN